MKKFLSNIFIFSILAIAVIAGIEYLLYMLPSELKYKREYLENHGNNIKTLVMGHSHTAMAIKPGLLGDSSFNVASQGRSIYYDKEILKRHLDDMPNLKYIIFPIGYNFFYKNSVPSDNNEPFLDDYATKLHKYWGIPPENTASYKYISEIRWHNFNIVDRFIYPQSLGCEPDGFECYPLSIRPSHWRDWDINIECNYDDPKLQQNFMINLGYLKEMIDLCQSRGIKFILISTPHHELFLRKVTKRGLDSMQSIIDYVQSSYDIPYLNYMSDKRFTDDDFFNPSHLSDQGATKFTPILRDDIRRVIPDFK